MLHHNLKDVVELFIGVAVVVANARASRFDGWGALHPLGVVI